MIKVTLSRWKYNNTDFRITKESEYIECSLIAQNCADAMQRIWVLKQNNNLDAFTHYEIIEIEDI